MRRLSIGITVFVALMALGSILIAQQPPAGGAAPAATAPAGRGRGPAPIPPGLLFKEEWQFPPYTPPLTDENRRATQAAVTNPRLELKTYGADAKNILVYEHEQRHDLWTGLTASPVAILLRDKANALDLTGLARLHATVETQPLHTLYPALKLADGTFLVGTRGVNTGGDFIAMDFLFTRQRWFRLDATKISTGPEVMNPDLTNVDEVGFVDLAPGSGHGNSGNVSTVELYAKPVPRTAAK